MQAAMQWLKGKKTYLVAAAIVLEAAAAFLGGDADLGQAARQILEGLGIATLRAGVAGGR